MFNIEKELIQPIGDHNPKYNCVKTSCLEHICKYPYSYFNPMQSDFIDHLGNENKNIILSAGTGSGKTVCAELAAAMTLYSSECSRKAIFLAPMKSLTDQKFREWSDPSHGLSKYKVSALTGDHALTKEKAKELEESDIILCTSEMLDSKTRSYENNKWLHNAGVLIVDETHLLGAKERGPRLETAIMRFSECNPDCRIILMSGTIPNADDIYLWLTNLTGKETQLIVSDYKSCLVDVDFIQFNDNLFNKRKKYFEIENIRMESVIEQILKNPNDQHLIFVGNKAFGRNLSARMNSMGLGTAFHSADLSQDERFNIEENFNNERIKYLVASSTLAWGVNLNARRVILAHTSYGLGEMDVADIAQAMGRAGRAQYYDKGNAYIVLASSKFESEKRRISDGFTITSKLKDQKVLAFHIVSEICSGKIKNANDLFEWYKKSLSYCQNHDLTEDDAEALVSKLKKIKMIKQEENGDFIITPLGQISSQMYQNPYDVYDWFRNFTFIPEIGIPFNGSNKAEVDEVDLQVCWALANIDSYQEANGAFISVAEKESAMVEVVAGRVGKVCPATKIAACYWYMLKGYEPDDVLRSQFYALKGDLKRALYTIQLIHSKYATYVARALESMEGWRYEASEWDRLFLRLSYGVSRTKLFLVSIPEIGKTFADKLYSAGIKTRNDLFLKKALAVEILGKKRSEKVYSYLESANKK